MADNSTSRGSRQKVREWCYEVFDSMSRLDEKDMFGFAEKALRKAGNDGVRQTLVELSIGTTTPGITAALVRAAVRCGTTQLARAAADLLIDIKDDRSATAIIEECLESDDSAIRVRAVEAMEMLEGPEMFDLLQKALRSGDDNVRRATVNSLGLIVASKYHPLKAHMLESLADKDSELFRTFSQTDELSLKREFAQVLGFADTDAVLPLLRELSSDTDTQTRREALLALAANGSSKAMEITEQKLDDEDEMVVTFALDSLASKVGRDSEHMFRCIQKVMDHPNASVRRNAVMMLNWFPPSMVEDLLAEAAGDSDFEVQRSAQSLLRTMKAELAPIGLEETGAGDWGEDTLKIWEVGNVGMESERSEKKSTVDTDVISTDAIVAELEKQAASGDVSKRSHAITELLELEDISDSPMLRKALYEDDESVRARVARALDFTRDAGLATQVLLEHPDSLVRRRAVEALAENPSGRTKGDPGRSGITFASERTQGMELFSYFLRALDDPDEGVVQSGCYAIGHYLQFKRPIPVRETIEKLQSLEANTYLSSLTRDNAAELIDDINDAKLGEPLVNTIDAAVSASGELSRHIARLSWDPEKENFAFDTEGKERDILQAELIEELLSGADAANRIAEAAHSDGPFDEGAAAAYAGAVCSTISVIFDAVSSGAEALARLGETGWTGKLKEWQAQLNEFPTEAFDTNPAFQNRKKDLSRALSRAIISAKSAVQSLREGLDPGEFAFFTESGDDWIRMAALSALRDVWTEQHRQELRTLLEQHAGDEDFDPVLGRAALRLLEDGDREAIDVLAGVLERCEHALRIDLLHDLVAAVQQDEVQHAVAKCLENRSLEPMSALGMKMALLAGRGGKGIDMEPGTGSGEPECRRAYQALKAMNNNRESAEELKNALRGGKPAEREIAGAYLGLARVESATSVFASVSDQVDAAWSLRALCGGLMIRKGHRQGMGWFNKNAGHGTAATRGLIAWNLGRAMAGTIPLMLRCNEVNIGRFV